ncbi:uncharacterized protein LOC143293663 isoform X2 [Babylonia areolata]|uniref:uncharacterized protein LOC143293663 isoform X2 n=1 Tax=Babylonia areolata TaxID=304850 RepID=UPI003FD685F5
MTISPIQYGALLIVAVAAFSVSVNATCQGCEIGGQCRSVGYETTSDDCITTTCTDPSTSHTIIKCKGQRQGECHNDGDKFTYAGYVCTCQVGNNERHLFCHSLHRLWSLLSHSARKMN